jgi:hypothetical protein
VPLLVIMRGVLALAGFGLWLDPFTLLVVGLGCVVLIVMAGQRLT